MLQDYYTWERGWLTSKYRTGVNSPWWSASTSGQRAIACVSISNGAAATSLDIQLVAGRHQATLSVRCWCYRDCNLRGRGTKGRRRWAFLHPWWEQFWTLLHSLPWTSGATSRADLRNWSLAGQLPCRWGWSAVKPLWSSPLPPVKIVLWSDSTSKGFPRWVMNRHTVNYDPPSLFCPKVWYW